MRILRVHNQYQQPGGEDVSFASEVELLREHGHDVATLVVANDAIADTRSPLASARLATMTIWSRSGRALVANAVSRHQPEVVHFDNTFPLISPAAYAAARSGGAAVVQTLHNYRLICPGATLYRDDSPCQDCVGRPLPVSGVIHRCYRNSAAETAVVAAMLATHRVRRTWSSDVERFIALTSFSRDLFVAGGLSHNQISVKPNFVRDQPRQAMQQRKNIFLYVGRLSSEKGVETLLNAATRLPADYQLHIAGDGPLKNRVTEVLSDGAPIIPLGRIERCEVTESMQTARALIFPSVWYEGCPMTLIEAFASGLPVIASRLGAMAEMIDSGNNGLLFSPGSADELDERLRWAADNPAAMAAMGERARQTYQRLYTPERNYRMLMDIYDQAKTLRAGCG